MAKGQRRGWRKFFPASISTITVVFFSLVVIKLVNRAVLASVPADYAKYWPAV